MDVFNDQCNSPVQFFCEIYSTKPLLLPLISCLIVEGRNPVYRRLGHNIQSASYSARYNVYSAACGTFTLLSLFLYNYRLFRNYLGYVATVRRMVVTTDLGLMRRVNLTLISRFYFIICGRDCMNA
jgi:hypothetical protein